MLAFINTSSARLAILSITTALIIMIQTDTSRADSLITADLAISFDIARQEITGEMKLFIPPDTPLTLYVEHLEIEQVEITGGSKNQTAPQAIAEHRIDFGKDPYHRSVKLIFQKTIEPSYYNIISAAAIVLTSGWHPIPDLPILFSLTAQIPATFSAISETDRIEQRQDGEPVRFAYSQPLRSLNFAAAPWHQNQLKIRDDLTIYTLFFEQDEQLAQDYLEAAARFLQRYEKLLGPYPYGHYFIVENLMPTGFGFPGFTLLGKQILRLPFIRTTSLGHEILHCWLGHQISVADDSGNWVEGLTTYLADLAYRQDAGQGASSRKEVIQNYLNYVKPDTPPLESFYSPGQHAIADKALRAVGYGRSAMLFHEIRTRIGDEAFYQSLQRLYQNFAGKQVGWQDLQQIFAQESSTTLAQLFSQHLTRIDLPQLTVTDLTTKQQAGYTELRFTVVQQNEQPFELLLPILIKTIGGETSLTRLLKEKRTTITVKLDSQPLKLILDPEYDILRALQTAEKPPVLSQLLGASAVLMVAANPDQLGPFEPVRALAAQLGWRMVSADSLSQAELLEQAVVFLGPSDLSRGIFGTVAHPDNGFTIDIRKNPLAPEQVMALVSSSAAAATETALKKLRHYGNYSLLQFANDQLVQKKKTAAARGMSFTINSVPEGIAVSSINNFDTLVQEISSAQIIYVGEHHTSPADHLLQLMLIERLHQHKGDIVIGMEMFPRSSQAALDTYLEEPQVLEADFLKASRYFEVWGYDFRLFRPIFAFARNHRIPIVGLNIERNIVSSVFKTGIIKPDEPADQNRIPRDRHLDLPGYTERLIESYQGHTGLSLSTGAGTSAGFIQAQSLWDESMAVAIVNYLQEHPEKTMVVLAGTQHTRKDSGIPPRVAKRASYAQASIINLATASLSGNALVQTVDYGFFLESPPLPPLGKIGIVLEPSKDDLPPGMKVTEILAGSTAAEAGLMVGDILVELAGVKIREMADVTIAMVGRGAGEALEITVMREDSGAFSPFDLEVFLYQPKPPKPHP